MPVGDDSAGWYDMVKPAALKASSTAAAGTAYCVLPNPGRVMVKTPSTKPRSGAGSVCPPNGSGIVGNWVAGSCGTPGSGIGMGAEPGVVFGTVIARPGTVIRLMASDEALVSF